MLYDWNTTATLAERQDLSPQGAFTLGGTGLWAVLVSRGECRFSGSPPRLAQAGMVALGQPPLAGQPQGSCHLLALRLAGRAAQDFAAALPPGPYLARGESCPAAAELMGQLADAQPGGRLQSQLVFSLLCELSGADAADAPLPSLVQAAVADIRQNYAGLYGVEELSERLGVSKSHLVRAFHAAMGVSPGKYLTGVRIEAAKRLLLHREYSLDIVASLCGFSGANYLCRVFKKETGESPAAWRAAALARTGPRLADTPRERELYV